MIDPVRKRRPRFSMARWPEAIRTAFLAAFGAPATPNDRRLARSYDRWLEAAAAEGLPPDVATQELWRRRSAGLPTPDANAMRAAVAAVHDAHVVLFARETPTRVRLDARVKLARLVARRLAEWPGPWREAGVPLLAVDPDGLLDGRLVAAWSPATVKLRVWALTRLLRHAAGAGLAVDVTPSVVKSWLAREQERVKRQETRITYAVITLGAAAALAPHLMPGRDWRWLTAAAEGLKKVGKGAPSRNESRLASALELLLVGRALFADACTRLAAATGRRQRTKALRQARAGLAICLLVWTPIRLGSLVGLDLDRHFDAALTRLRLEADETKEGAADEREIAPELRAMLMRYIENFRPITAAAACRTLFVSERTGGPMDADRLSGDVTTACKAMLGRPVNVHAFRHAVATYIASEAPTEVPLATTVLNHASDKTTKAYNRRADQMVASRTLAAARAAAARKVVARPARTST
ncbi:site-specific integrase [Rubrimonas cliftonensis]|uniref:Phage integrase family protein n=1 Tax=Rubrimonas cliftonensis TaxID=89524 RepID=A0A1H4FGA8_9RHOB|nr:site-specific integrase [Rubrimonas cliftonensis]SEA96316.1 Phage integrase family protein [Rubrimonas cliftonensis]